MRKHFGFGNLKGNKFRAPAMFVILLLGIFLAFASTASAQVQIQRPNYPFAQHASNALTGDLIQFHDGSLLHGTLQAVDPAKGLQWSHPDAAKPIEFKPSNIESIRFDNSKIATRAQSSCKFRFANGDEFFGNLTSLGEESLSLETWFGKDLKVQRSAMDSVIFLSRSLKVLYEGPTSADGWRFGMGNLSWRYRDGSLVANGVGTVGRDFKLPAACIFEFDLAWIGDPRLGVEFRLTMPFYTDVLDRFDYGSSAYLLQFHSSAVGLQRVHAEMGVSNIGNSAPIANLQKKNSYHVEIRANKEDATIAVYIDGTLLNKWRDEGGFSAKGSGAVFFCQNEGPTIKISNIRVSEWDGKFEEERSVSRRKEDTLHLANRDKVAGKIGALRDGKLDVKIEGEGPLEIPLQRVSQVFFGGEAAKATPSQPWNVRAAFASGEKVSFQLEKWSGEEVAGMSSMLGKVAFNPETIRQIQFNLDEPKVARQPAPADEWESDGGSRTPSLAPEKQDVLVFRSGDLLYGGLLTFEARNHLRWGRADTLSPVEFKADAISEIRFRQQSQPQFAANCRVQLSNADQFEGKLAGIDADTVVFDTAFAGRMNLPRKRVVLIAPISTNRTVLFDGPTEIEGWVHGQVNAVADGGEFSYKDGALYATKAASIARDLKLPDTSAIQFDLAWKGTFACAVALYTSRMQPLNLQTKDSEPDFGGFYSLQLNSISSTLMMVKKDVPIKYLWRDQPVPAFSQKNSVRVEIRCDKSRRVVSMLVDGIVVKTVEDTDGFAGSGTAVRFVHHGYGSLRISNLRVMDWDGTFDEKPTNAKGADDLTKLRNRDTLVGPVESFRDGKFTVATDGSRIDVPLERVKQIELAGKKVEAPTTDVVEAIAFFRNGAPIRFRIEKWDEKGIHASSGNFGKATLNPAAFARIVFRQPQTAEELIR